MKFLTSVYREALYKDFKSSVTEANAYDLQQVLYKHSRVFGNLYKFENFRNVFALPPVSSEFVIFLKFWRGVESLLDKKSHILPSMPDVLQKACFVDDPYVTSMRYFRDEILKNEMSLTKTELLETIKKSQKKSDLVDFWPKVMENTKKMFANESVSVMGVSYMVFTFFAKKYSLDLESHSELETEQTSLTSDEYYENKSSLTESAREYDEHKFDFKLDDSKVDSTALNYKLDDSIWSYEYKYRKLLFDLETSLPKFYTCYSETKSELSQTKEDLRKLMETNDSMKNQYSIEKEDLLKSNINLEEKVRELNDKNANLNSLLMERDVEIEEFKKRVDELTEKYNSTDTYKFSKELLVYKARSEGLERTNEGLKSSVEELERAIESLTQEKKILDERLAEIGSPTVLERDDRVSVEVMQELDDKNKHLLDQNKKLMSERDRLLETLKKIELDNSSLEDELEKLQKLKNKAEQTVNKLESQLVELKNETQSVQQDNQRLTVNNLNLQKTIDNFENKMVKTTVDGSNEALEALEQTAQKLKLENELLESELKDSKLFIEDYKLKMDDYRQTIENYKSTIESYKETVNEYKVKLESSELTVNDYKTMVENYKATIQALNMNGQKNERSNDRSNYEGMAVTSDNQDIVNELRTIKRENELLQLEYVKLRDENERNMSELEELNQKMEELMNENKKLKEEKSYYKELNNEQIVGEHLQQLQLHHEEIHQKNLKKLKREELDEKESLKKNLADKQQELESKKSELDKYLKKLSETEEKLDDLQIQNVNLKEKLNDIIQENINLVAKLEFMNLTSPKNATNKLMEMIGKYNDVQSPLSYESETTDYDLSDPSELSTVENRLKINPDLAETRRLNTLNAIKFGLIKTNTDTTSGSTRSNNNGGMISSRSDNRGLKSTSRSDNGDHVGVQSSRSDNTGLKSRSRDQIDTTDTNPSYRTDRYGRERATTNRSGRDWEKQENKTNPIIYRNPGKLKRSVSIREESPADSYYDSLSMSNYEELGIQEEPDILQNAISFLSRKFNLN